MTTFNNRILVNKELGDFACGDIYYRDDNQTKLSSEELDLDEKTTSIFKENSSIIVQIWKENGFVHLASKVLGHERLIRVKEGLFDNFELHIIQPAKGGGEIDLRIKSPNYSGHILKGATRQGDISSFDKIINEMEDETIPKIIALFNGEITDRKKIFNA